MEVGVHPHAIDLMARDYHLHHFLRAVPSLLVKDLDG
jgi:hypothetical protein